MKQIPARLYQTIWNQIKLAKEYHIHNPGSEYIGTCVHDIPPQQVRRVDKAVRKEKSTFDGDNWALGRYLKLQSSYDSTTFTLTFTLVPYRKHEARARVMRNLL